MVVYNVTVKIDKAIETPWLEWMKNVHSQAVLATGKFVGHNIFRLIGGEDESGVTYAMQFFCEDLKTLHHYQIHDAPRLQQIHKEKFPEQFAAFRSILEEV